MMSDLKRGEKVLLIAVGMLLFGLYKWGVTTAFEIYLSFGILAFLGYRYYKKLGKDKMLTGLFIVAFASMWMLTNLSVTYGTLFILCCALIVWRGGV